MHINSLLRFKDKWDTDPRLKREATKELTRLFAAKVKAKTGVPRFHVEGRRWFERTNGNTYHTAKVTDLKTGKVAYQYISYGYGDCWMQNARCLIWGFIYKTPCELAHGVISEWSMDNPGAISSTVQEVRRKRDLHNEGKWPR